MSHPYDHKKIEQKWQKRWEAQGASRTDDQGGEREDRRYVLDMFPYPSSQGLHVGHPEGYTATDIMSRYLRMQGHAVLHPMGWDAFGLPAENYAIKVGIHPHETTAKSIENFRRQIKSLGFSYDWFREVNTADPDYYRWTQWFFLLLYQHGLAYKKKAPVNWCEHCQTVLAREQVVDGKCERCKNAVVQKELAQWFFKITDFIEERTQDARGKKHVTAGLPSGLEKIDWPEPIKLMQRNWIGKSDGAEIEFQLVVSQTDADRYADSRGKSQRWSASSQRVSATVKVFTTRPDTLFGATYIVLAPEHPFVASLLKLKNQKSKIKNVEEVEAYISTAKTKTELERGQLQKEKTGVALEGITAINPATNEEIPIWIADYVLMGYGTGAIMAVPAHDERDHAFAQKFGIPIREVINHNAAANDNSSVQDAYEGEGTLVNSGEFNGLDSLSAREKIVLWLEQKDAGESSISYKLRDWLISRQRYWGAPIPVIYCGKCPEISKSQFPISKQTSNPKSQIVEKAPKDIIKIDGKTYAIVPVPEKDLPVRLPDDVDFRPTGESPLNRSKKFHEVACPKCGAQGKDVRRECDTMDTFVDSSWYFFRYTDPQNAEEFASREKIHAWLPVNLYVGGAEHAVMHLMYARFFTKVLHWLGVIDFDEPFLTLKNQGLILGEDGQKMSKSRGNVINPDEVIGTYGADTMRMYEMFMGPFEDAKPWSTRSIIGVRRFLERVWSLGTRIHTQAFKGVVSAFKSDTLARLVHQTIKKITEDIEAFKFNTAIAQLMTYTNELSSLKNGTDVSSGYKVLLMLLAPFAPHVTEELWEQLGNKKSIFQESWPVFDPALMTQETAQVVIQIDGKRRGIVEVSRDAGEEEVYAAVNALPKVQKYLKGKEMARKVYVKGKLINLVTQD